MKAWTSQEIGAAIEEINRRSVVDPEFRSLAINDARAAFASFNPAPLPTGFNPKFVDNSGSTQTIPLPNPLPGVSEIPEDELESVAGGWDVSVGFRSGSPRPTSASGAQ